jgi:hypothetical protein
MTLSLTINGSTTTVSTSKNDTTFINYGPETIPISPHATVSLKIKVVGPAGTVSCSA